MKEAHATLPARIKDSVGLRYGRLVVTAYAGRLKTRQKWSCVCDCGNTVVVNQDGLRRGSASSCGCLRLERARAANTTHGHSLNGRLGYYSWRQMLARCHNPNNPFYGPYGGRGIKVCVRWRYGENGIGPYQCFIADIGPRPSLKHSIDRVNNDGDYEPDNCRWATYRHQARNLRRNVYIQYAGRVLILQDALKAAGITQNQYRRFYKPGLQPQASFDKAVAAHGLINR